MIDIKELRIGSHFLLDGKPKKVIQIGYDMVVVDDNRPFNPCHVKEIDPIPLTIELLDKQNYDEDEIVWWEIGDYFHFEFIKGDSYNLEGYEIQVNLRYVHELQNALVMCGIEKEFII